ncbi:MAG TPA: efflux RND transporter periplasmic adaptor subunit [Candidatus Paceibacterota bacterium]
MNFAKILKSKKVIFGILVALGIASIFVFGGENGGQILTVERGEIVQEVAATGKVKPARSVDLGFDKSGRVAIVRASVGDFVRAGETIASLESGEVSSDIAKARAVLDEEILRLREIENVSPRSYEDSARSLEVALQDAFLTSDNAIRNKVDQFFENVPQNPRFEVSFTDGNFIHYFPVPTEQSLALNNERIIIEEILKAWEASKNTESLETDPYKSTEKAISNMKTILDFLDSVASAMNSFSPANFEYETTVNGYKTSISNARSDVATSFASLISAKDKLNLAPQLDSQTGEYKDVLIQKAKVDQARSALSSLEATLGKAVIRAPFDGLITVQDAKVGAAVNAGETLVSMTSNQDMYIEANISEINIGKLKEGNSVSVKFDAFPGEDFRGFVSFIEPGDILVEGVVNYKIRVDFGNIEKLEDGTVSWNYDGIDPRIKNGLTADLKIETSKIDNAVVLPLYAVSKEDGKSFVNKVVNGKQEKIEINLGREGSDGMAEVVDGLNPGDLVVF